MLDFFAIISKSGIVLWYIHDLHFKLEIVEPINALIKSVILQERSVRHFGYEDLILEYKLDNEFELVFVLGYQKFLSLSYVDKFLTLIEQKFRDRYKEVLLAANLGGSFDDFDDIYQSTLRSVEEASRHEKHNKKEIMSTFEESKKSKKTVASMIDPKSKKSTGNEENSFKKKKEMKGKGGMKKTPAPNEEQVAANTNGTSETSLEDIENKRLAFFQKQLGLSKSKKKSKGGTQVVVAGDTSSDSSPQPVKKGKESRRWDNCGTKKEAAALDRSANPGSISDQSDAVFAKEMEQYSAVSMSGTLKDIADEDENENRTDAKKSPPKNTGIFGMFKGLVGGKVLTEEDLEPVLEKFRDHLIAKNVAQDTSEQIVGSVATKLCGKAVGTFASVQSSVRACLEETCLRLLTPHRRVDILRDVEAAVEAGRPYVVVFCGVNGVGKSTNLAKIAFWLLENNRRVMIAACDTFRSGAIEQLRTHLRKLETKHKGRVELYGQDYGSNASAVARNAISEAKRRRFDVVLVDTAGRMQDNAPLMAALAKLIHENSPDRVLFVGEALVGNEAVDQLKKFNEALVDLGKANSTQPQSIDGIVLTKFDTVDDKVGAALSMTHHSGQPIVMVGTGQTYTDLKALSAKAVVNALLR